MTTEPQPPAHDPYGGCEKICTHDLARGVLVSELLDEEGPYPNSHPLLTTPNIRRWFPQAFTDSPEPLTRS